ncbi:FkbM family methyltransferase [Pedobacter sp. SYSU D00535]|uniref:FkbM family methyltransferase n=1 Tax=Pedobacter sp. SYSU D00535 TaxID=2810308 RepID=UPI001A95AAFD|nr:FkbM family methyltransferase [Pedobacter sp. SYSU D00535]
MRILDLIKVLRTINSHPMNRKAPAVATFRFLKWQLSCMLNPYPVIYPFTDKAKLVLKKGMAGATGNLYCGLDEYHDMAFLLHFLRQGDLFVDVGANIGSYTVLAGAHVGARVVAIEPISATFEQLMQNIRLNNVQDSTTALNIGIGGEPGTLTFTNNMDTVNHVTVDEGEGTISIPVDKLDNVLAELDPSLLKIDVEGFENEVIRGGGGILSKDSLKAIIIELNGLSNRYGHNQFEVHKELVEKGYEPFSYDPITRLLRPTKEGRQNTLYVKDLNYVQQRLITAEKVKVFNQLI